MSNTSAAGIPVIIYNGNDDTIVQHFANEGMLHYLELSLSFFLKTLAFFISGHPEHDIRGHTRIHAKAFHSLY